MPDSGELRRALRRDEELARRLVRLEPIEIVTLRRAINDVERLLDRHRAEFEGPPRRDAPEPPARVRRTRRLVDDHATHAESIDQLRWLVGIIERDDHGGNRQALGQYWAILVEATLRHLDEEDAAPGRSPGEPPSAPPDGPAA